MKADIAQRLIAALRSGEYKPQTERFDKIKHGDTWSILGVLSDLHCKEFEGSWIGGYYLPPGEVRGQKHWLNKVVMDWAGVRHKLMPISGYGVLGTMGDLGYTHAQLADIIEKTWEDL